MKGKRMGYSGILDDIVDAPLRVAAVTAKTASKAVTKPIEATAKVFGLDDD
jgi:hypothetical protein